MIVVLMYLDFDAAANKAADDLDYFFDEYKVENAQFTTAEDINYVLSLLLLRGKAGKVDLVESLKDNRE